jgi:hypothetical protein
VPVTGLSSGVAEVAAGGAFTCALTAAGSVLCWGDNGSGELGNGSTTSTLVPIPLTDLASGVTAVSASPDTTNEFACAVTAAGDVECWGDNGAGQLGDGSTTSRSFPAAVSGVTAASAVSVGLEYACAIAAGGAVECWGNNGNGELGDGTTITRRVPAPVVGLSSGVTSLSVGTSFSPCAVTAAGGVVCWGYNGSGQLGNGSTNSSTTPVPVSGLSNGVTKVAAGGSFACALTAGGGVQCWGLNGQGQLGDGTTTDSSVPVPVTGLSSGVTGLSVGGTSACATTADGLLECWGQGYFGQLGDGSLVSSTIPVAVAGFAPLPSLGDGRPTASISVTLLPATLAAPICGSMPGSGTANVINNGSSDAVVTVSVSPGFTADPASVTLAPGKLAQLNVTGPTLTPPATRASGELDVSATFSRAGVPLVTDAGPVTQQITTPLVEVPLGCVIQNPAPSVDLGSVPVGSSATINVASPVEQCSPPIVAGPPELMGGNAQFRVVSNNGASWTIAFQSTALGVQSATFQFVMIGTGPVCDPQDLSFTVTGTGVP